MYMYIRSDAYQAECSPQLPKRITRVAEVEDFTRDTARDTARAWIQSGRAVIAAIVDGSRAHPTRWNRLERAQLGPRGGLPGVGWGLAPLPSWHDLAEWIDDSAGTSADGGTWAGIAQLDGAWYTLTETSDGIRETRPAPSRDAALAVMQEYAVTPHDD